MRIWIAHLISNSSAYNDFQDWVAGAVRGLNEVLADTVRTGDMESARGVAHELKVYEDLQKSVKREVREQRSQVTYLNETKGA